MRDAGNRRVDERQYSNELASLPIQALLRQLASSNAAPGGGSAAALCGALAASLAAMVARLTIGRRKYAAIEEDMIAWRDKADLLQERLLALAAADAQAYTELMDAYHLTNESADEEAQRAESIQAALHSATEVPLRVALASADVLELLALVARYGNQNATTDAAVGALLAHAALRGAVLSVLVNLKDVEDPKFVQETDALVAQLMTVAKTALADTMASVDPGE